MKTEYEGIDRYLTVILFSGDGGMGELPPLLYKHSSLPPKQCEHIEVTAETPAKLAKSYEKSLLTPKRGAEQFPNNFCTSADSCFVDFVNIMSLENVSICIKKRGKLPLKSKENKNSINENRKLESGKFYFLLCIL